MLSAKQNIDLLERAQRTFNLKRLIDSLASRGGRVFDAGCGSGILSVWSALAGASEVFAVDNGSMEMPGKLAKANGVDDRIEFFRADLNELEIPSRDQDKFDLLLALVYLNDPRRDIGQVELAHRLAERFVKEGGDMIPDRVAYTALVASCPDEHFPTKEAVTRRRVAALEGLYGLDMSPLLEQRLVIPEKEDFPARGPEGYVRCGSMRHLSKEVSVFDHSYREANDPIMPGSISLRLGQTGSLDIVIWSQKLYFGDLLIFQNESISWVENPTTLEEGTECTLEMGKHWQVTNRILLK